MQAWDKFLEIKHAQSEDVQELLNKLIDDVRNINEELAEYTNTPSWNLPNSSYDDDDDEESSIPLKDIIMSGLSPCVAITPDSPKMDSLIMVDKHLDTILKTESDEFIKSSVENLVPTPSESKDASNGECDLPVCDDFPKSHLVTFSNPLFDIDDDCTSSDDESFSEEDVPMENFKIFSNPLFDLDEEIIATEIDSLLDDSEGEIHPVERLLYDNSSPRPPEDSNYDVSDAITKSFSLSPIPIEDSDSLREEIDIFPGPDDSIPPGIESDDFDSEDDDNSTFLPEFESLHVDYPNSGDSTIDVVEDIPMDVPNILPTHPALLMDFDFIHLIMTLESTRFLAPLSPMINTLLPFSSENEDKVFTYGVLASKEKSPTFSSHRGFKAFKLFHHRSPMLIHEKNTPNLGVRHPHFYPP
ncbi:hypothetical protein Tco_0912130 [Tanacetum coccineum]